jgi:hypothetical protein
MPILVQCNGCGKRIKAPDRLAGKRAKCKCGAILAIPAAQPAGQVAAAQTGPQPATHPSANEATCPDCQAPMPDGAVLCTACGFNVQSGQRLSLSVDDAPSSTKRSRPKRKSKGQKSKPQADRTASAAPKIVGLAFSIAKWAVVLGLVGGLAWVIKEGLSFSPAQQAQDALNSVYPGMTVQAVVDALGKKPQEVHVYEEKDTSSPFPIPVDKRAAYRDDFMKNTDAALLKHGFYFVYTFSQRDNLMIHFNPNGKVNSSELWDPMKILGL